MKALKRHASAIMKVVRWVLLVAVVGFAIAYLVSQWPAVSQAITEIAPLSLVASMGVLIVGVVCITLSWVSLLNGLGHRISLARASQILLVGQLGKYVPGSVWAYVMQMELGRQHGVARARVLVASLYAAGIGVVASLMLGALALPIVVEGHEYLMWLFALLPVGLVCLHPAVMTFLANLVLRVFRRPPLQERIRLRVVLTAVGWSLAGYVLYGVHLWLLVNSLVQPDVMTLVLLTGGISLGFTIGLLAFLLPSGVGVREAVLVAAMSVLLTVPEASGVSLVSRGMFTLADLLTAGGAVLAVMLRRRRIVPEETAADEYAGSEATAGLEPPAVTASEAPTVRRDDAASRD